MVNRQSEKSEATKQKLIEAAQKLFYKKGFDKTSVKEIVHEAGVAHGTFYLYFETKHQILFKILDGAFESFNFYLNNLNATSPTIDQIDYIIDAVVIYMEQNPELIRLLHNANTIEVIGYSKYDELSDWFMLSMLEEWLESASQKGIIKNKPPQMYAKLLFQITHELLESAFLYQFPDKIDVVKQEVKQIIRKILS